MDALTIIAVISGLTGLGVAVLSHLRHSECCSGCCKIDTRTPPTTPHISEPMETMALEKEKRQKEAEV